MTSLDIPGGHLAALQAGDAADPPVLMVPGFTGSKEDFAPILKDVARAGFFVTAIDQRGQWESPPIEDPSAYTVAALARDVLAVAAALGPVHLLGHSFGGLVTRAAAIAEPARFRSLTLMGSGPAALGGARRERLDRMEPVLREQGVAAVRALLEEMEALDPGAAARTPEQEEFERQRFLASPLVMLQGMADALRNEPDRVAELAATRLPVLVIHGADDDAWPPAVQSEMAERLDAEYVVVPDAKHSPAEENPDDTARLLVDYWRSLEPAP